VEAVVAVPAWLAVSIIKSVIWPELLYFTGEPLAVPTAGLQVPASKGEDDDNSVEE
jgi:hypothetical protein